MNKKSKLFSILLLFISFFMFMDNASAVRIKGNFFYDEDVYSGATYYLKGVSDIRYLASIGVFQIGDKEQAYCIEPGVSLSDTGYENNNNTVLLSSTEYKDSKFIKDSVSKRTNIARILTFAHKSSSPGTVVSSKNMPEYTKIVAAQALIWEVVTGERTNFLNVKPNNKINNSLYDIIHSGKSDRLKQTAEEYDRIVKSIYNTFNYNPGPSTAKFKTALEAQKQPVAMIWDSATGKYKLEISDAAFQYWKIKSNDSGITFNMNSQNNTITITSANPIDYSSAKKVTIQVKNNNDVASASTVYKSGTYQDVVTIHGTSIEKSLYVYTPKFQMKVVKTAELDTKPLEGVIFNLYSDKNCTSSVLAELTTNNLGVATYSELPKPGTYCIKEVSTVKGYELDTTPYKVDVKKDNISGSNSFATKQVSNKNKIVNLSKFTKDKNNNIVLLDDGCGTDLYTGPEFEILENGNPIYIKEIKPGEYDYSSKEASGATTKIKTCNGKFKVYTLPNCNYTITETAPPKGLTLPGEPSKAVNVCGSDKNISFTNGFTGVEFQKKDEDGNFISGGKFSIQRKENNIYRDILLKKIYQGYYEYIEGLSDEDADASYIFETSDDEYELGKAFIDNLPPGEYRIVEKEAPEGFELIADKDSTALITIKDVEKDYYLVELINRKSNKEGSEASAEFIVTITTGRKVPNYVLMISTLAILLVITIILRKKSRK